MTSSCNLILHLNSQTTSFLIVRVSFVTWIFEIHIFFGPLLIYWYVMRRNIFGKIPMTKEKENGLHRTSSRTHLLMEHSQIACLVDVNPIKNVANGTVQKTIRVIDDSTCGIVSGCFP